MIDGRAHDAARYSTALCKAICRGVIKEKIQRSLDVRAVVDIREGEHSRRLDLEENHEEEDTDVAAYSTHVGDLCEEEKERRVLEGVGEEFHARLGKALAG